MKKTITITPLIVFFGLLFASAAFGQESAIRVGDKIVIEIKGVPIEDRQEISSTYTVGDSGALHLPHLGSPVAAVGSTPSTLARAIEAAYRSSQIFTKPTIVIAPLSGDATQQRVVVMGEVRSPHQVPYAPGMTLLEAIAACQGFTDFAKEKEIKLIRADRTTVHDLSKISKNPQLDPKLKPGDRIVVPQRGPFG